MATARYLRVGEPDQLDWGQYAEFSKKLNLKFVV